MNKTEITIKRRFTWFGYRTPYFVDCPHFGMRIPARSYGAASIIAAAANRVLDAFADDMAECLFGGEI